ncbi:MAG: isoprenylcysteine carboxylmethyltransferase family protein [Spirochaetes bacterium]|nr:isoprenylcysteine carboxylmethyltransferase family protein [Spirochaetota bacterium]
MDVVYSNVKWFAVAYIILFQTFFILKNIITRKKTGVAVNAANRDVKNIVLCFVLVFSVSIFSLFFPAFYARVIPIDVMKNSAGVLIAGMVFLVGAFILALVSSIQLGASWRVGVLEHQRVDLVDEGVYRFCRNPYFVAYFMQIAGFFLIAPSVILLMLVVISLLYIHRMVIKEEKYLMDLHGTTYAEYCRRTGRYLPKFRIKEKCLR